MKVHVTTAPARVNVTERRRTVIHLHTGQQGPPGPPGPKGDSGGVPDEPWVAGEWNNSPLAYALTGEPISWTGNSAASWKGTKIGRTAIVQIVLAYLTRRRDWEEDSPISIPVSYLPWQPKVGGAAFLLGTSFLNIVEGPPETHIMSVQLFNDQLLFLPLGENAGGTNIFWSSGMPTTLDNRRFNLLISLTYETED